MVLEASFSRSSNSVVFLRSLNADMRVMRQLLLGILNTPTIRHLPELYLASYSILDISIDKVTRQPSKM